VSKDMLRAADRDKKLISKAFVGKFSNYVNSTTGSSGEPIKVVLNRNSLDERVGSVYAISEWVGLHVGDVWMNLWRAPLHTCVCARVQEALTGKVMCSIYDPDRPNESTLDPERMDEIIASIKNVKPKIIDGYVSALALLSRHMIDNRVVFHFPLKSVVTGAEYLSTADRSLIEQAFHRPVFNRYGGTEFSVIAHECEAQAGGEHYLHTIDYRGVVETVKGNERIFDQEGALLFTDFQSWAMPLIRYQTGDVGIQSKRYSCACGRSLGVLKDVTGRMNDTFRLADGSYLSSHIWQHYFKKCFDIKKYQIIQESVDAYMVKLVLVPNADQHEISHVKELVQGALKDARVEWRTVDDIPPGPGGKLQSCVSNLKGK
jgi:phenylacetate-CoA ligase